MSWNEARPEAVYPQYRSPRKRSDRRRAGFLQSCSFRRRAGTSALAGRPCAKWTNAIFQMLRTGLQLAGTTSGFFRSLRQSQNDFRPRSRPASARPWRFPKTQSDHRRPTPVASGLSPR